MRHHAVRVLVLVIAGWGCAEAQDPDLLVYRVREGDYALRFAEASSRGALAELPVIPALIGLLEDDNIRVREAAGAALREVTGEDFGPDGARWSRWWAQRIRDPGGIPDGRVDLLSRLRTGSYLQRVDAVDRVARGGRREAVPALIELLRHENMNLRWQASRGLRVLTGHDFGVDRAAWERWWDGMLEEFGTLEGWARGLGDRGAERGIPEDGTPGPQATLRLAAPEDGAFVATEWRDVAANGEQQAARAADVATAAETAGHREIETMLSQRDAALMEQVRREGLAARADLDQELARRMRAIEAAERARAEADAADRRERERRDAADAERIRALREQEERAARERPVPTPPSDVARDADGWPSRGQTGVYTIQRGDTLAKLALRWRTTIQEILSVNPQVHNAHRIYFGRGLVVPPGVDAAE